LFNLGWKEDQGFSFRNISTYAAEKLVANWNNSGFLPYYSKGTPFPIYINGTIKVNR